MMVTLRVFTLVICAGLSLAVYADQYATKADYIVKFTRYTTWPSSSGDINICVVEPNPFGRALHSRADGKTAKQRKLVVKYISKGASSSGCEILFVSDRIGSGDISGILSRAGNGTLTIGESPGFLSKGGMIEFFEEGDKVRFDIDSGNAKKADVKLGAQLQKLASKRK